MGLLSAARTGRRHGLMPVPFSPPLRAETDCLPSCDRERFTP